MALQKIYLTLSIMASVMLLIVSSLSLPMATAVESYKVNVPRSISRLVSYILFFTNIFQNVDYRLGLYNQKNIIFTFFINLELNILL